MVSYGTLFKRILKIYGGSLKFPHTVDCTLSVSKLTKEQFSQIKSSINYSLK